MLHKPSSVHMANGCCSRAAPCILRAYILSARRTSPLSAEALTGAAYREKVKSLIYAEDKKELKGPERAAAIKKLKEKIAKLKK